MSMYCAFLFAGETDRTGGDERVGVAVVRRRDVAGRAHEREDRGMG